MSAKRTYPVVLAIHPTTRGFGWVAMEAPDRPVDWGITSHSPCGKPELSAAQLRERILRFRPEVIALEDWNERRQSTRGSLEPFMELVGDIASREGIALNVHSRHTVIRALGLRPGAGRSEILGVVLAHLTMLRHRAPREARPWQAVDRRLSLFLAAAAALATYWQEDQEIAA